jgi:hypothetical protein
MLGNSSVAERLVAAQEGLSSMESVGKLVRLAVVLIWGHDNRRIPRCIPLTSSDCSFGLHCGFLGCVIMCSCRRIDAPEKHAASIVRVEMFLLSFRTPVR